MYNFFRLRLCSPGEKLKEPQLCHDAVSLIDYLLSDYEQQEIREFCCLATLLCRQLPVQ